MIDSIKKVPIWAWISLAVIVIAGFILYANVKSSQVVVIPTTPNATTQSASASGNSSGSTTGLIPYVNSISPQPQTT